MSGIIYHNTGTGNSLWTVRAIAEGIGGAELAPMKPDEGRVVLLRQLNVDISGIRDHGMFEVIFHMVWTFLKRFHEGTGFLFKIVL